jgi:ABC-type phosphate transport system substrate-binding protein
MLRLLMVHARHCMYPHSRMRRYDFAIELAAATTADARILPTVASYPLQANAIVAGYNLPAAVTQGLTLAFTGLTLCRIHRANITQWTDSAITSVNTGMVWSDPSIVGQPIIVMTPSTSTTAHLALSTYCSKIDAGWRIAPSSYPLYPTASYAVWKQSPNLDLVCNAVSDNAYSITVAPLPMAKAILLDVASMMNAAGAAIAPTTNSVSLTVLEIGSNGYTGGNSFDLTAPTTLQAWPIVAMTSVYEGAHTSLSAVRSQRCHTGVAC